MKKYLLLLLLPILAFANIGKITALKGNVTIKRGSEVINAKAGTTLEKHDFISTSKAGKVQIVFKDHTIFTVGKNSTLDIAEYLYDESTPSNNKVQFNVLKGAFSSITGRIGKLNKSKFKLKTRSASIGIRGTIVKANQEIVMCTQGAITVVTNNGQKVFVEAGQKTDVSSGTPTAPESITDKDLEAVDAKPVKDDNKADEIQASTNEQAVQNTVTEKEREASTTNITLDIHTIDATGTKEDTTLNATQVGNEITTEASHLVLTDDNGEDTTTLNTQGVSWGHWDSDPTKKWVGGQTTNVQVLDNLRNSTTTVNATYNGKVMGTVNGTDNINMDSTNSVQVNFALGAGRNSMDGNIKFTTVNGQSWNADFTGSTSGSTFSSTTVSNNTDGSNVGVISAGSEVRGAFYGTDAQAVGGTFQLNNANDDTATGVFKATK